MAEPHVRQIIRRDEWDAFVDEHPAGSFLQSWAWGDLKARYGWSPLRLAIEMDGVLTAAVQMLVRTTRLTPIGPRAGLAYVPRGPLADTPAQTRQLVEAVYTEASDRGASFVRLEPPLGTPGDVFRTGGFRPTPHFIQIPRTAVIDLGRESDALLMSFKPKMRYNIRLAERRGIVVDVAQSDREFDAFFRLTQTTARREQFAIHTPAYYRDVWHAFRPDRGALFVAHLDGEPLAALMAVQFAGTAVYLYGASSNTHREMMAPHAVQWAAMRWAQDRGCTSYDLWGMADADDPNDAMAGVHRFKLGFNPEVVEYPGAFDRVIHPLRAWALTEGALRARDLLNRFRSRPVHMATSG